MLDIFRKAEVELTGLDVAIADLEQRLQQAEALTEGDLKRKAMALNAQTALRTEYAERAEALDEAMALFSQLGREIYSDRDVSLLIEPTDKGALKVVPRIDGDSSKGISGVKTFPVSGYDISVRRICLQHAPHGIHIFLGKPRLHVTTSVTSAMEGRWEGRQIGRASCRERV